MKLIDYLVKTFVNKSHRVEITGLEKLNFNEPTILMPNHTSLADAVILAYNLPENVVFVVNTDTAKKYAKFLKYRKHITVDPLNPYSVRQMIKVVKRGTPLMIFPEGRISVTGGLMKVYSGTGYIALKTGASVYPIAIHGLDRSKFSYLNDVNKTVWFPKVKISIGDAFRLTADDNMLMRERKNKSAEDILRILQEEKFKLANKSNVNLFNELIEVSGMYGQNKSIIEDISSKLTYKDMLIKTYVLSKVLERKLEGKQNISLLMPNSNAHAIALFSLFKIGKTPSILNFSMDIPDVLDCVENVNAQVVLTSKEFIAKGKLDNLIKALSKKTNIIYLEDIRNEITKSDELIGYIEFLRKKKSQSKVNEIILFTSGSESKPKGVVLTHDNIYSNIKQASTVIDFTQKDKLFNALPMFHSFGLTVGTLLPVLSGVETFLFPSPLLARTIPEVSYRFKTTILIATSTFLATWGRHAHRYDFFSMRYIVAGAEPVKKEVRDLFYTKFQKPILEGYGATEASPLICVNTPLFNKEGTVGQIVPGLDYKLEQVDGIQDGGNLFVKGPNIMKGYYIYGKGFIPSDEWYPTGDVVSIDKEGYVSIKARLKRFAKIAGEMVSLNKVEEVVGKCLNSVEVAVISVPDIRKGEKIILFTSVENATLSQIRKFIAENGLSGLLAPSEVIYLKKIPILNSGKTNYMKLKEIYSGNNN